MTIFTNMSKTKYYLWNAGVDTFTGSDAEPVDKHEGWGVFKPRLSSDQPADAGNDDGDATLNVAPADLPGEADLGLLIGWRVTVFSGDKGDVYRVIGVDVGKNFRTGQIEHYRLHLRRGGKTL